MPKRGVLGERAAEADLQIVRVRTERQQIHHRRHALDYSLIRVKENGSSPFSGLPR